MSNMIQGAYPVFTDIDGNPLEDGYIFIGEPGVDPIANPVSVYWDEALTIAATNIRTKGGYPDKSNVPGRLFVAGTYSILVQNKRGAEVYSEVTFFEAGAELSFDGSLVVFYGNICARRHNDDQIRCSVIWPEIPKQGTGLTLTLPATDLQVIDGAGVARIVSVAHTISNVVFNKSTIDFIIIETGAFTTLNQGQLGLRWSGIGGKLTIT